MTDEVKAAVERLTKLVGKPNTTPVRASVLMPQDDVRAVLQALSRLTEENERLREVLEGLAAILTETQARATKAEAALAEAEERERVKDEAAAPFLPITIRENRDYAEVTFGEHQTQAMTMAPADWLALNEAFTQPPGRADVLAWLAANQNVELSFDYGDADDDDDSTPTPLNPKEADHG